jgi:predicted thioesterase
MKEIKIGTTGTAELTVEYKDTAAALGEGLPEVFGTPYMVNLMEAAGIDALKDFIEEGEGSVGAAINTSHVSASPIGSHIRATATVKEVKGKLINFDVKAYDDEGLIGEGEHLRAVIKKEGFNKSVADKKARIGK